MSQDATVYKIPFSSIVKDDEVKKFETDVSALIAADAKLKLAIDMSQTFHISSRAIGLLVAFRKQVQPAGGQIVLFGVTPAVSRVLDVTRLNTLFSVVADEKEAMDLLRTTVARGSADKERH